MRQACINSSVIYRRKDNTVNYAAILTIVIDTGSIASCYLSKFYSNLLVVKLLEYCHDVKSQFVKSPAPTVTDPVRSPEHHEAMPGGTGQWPGVIRQSRSFDVRVFQVSGGLSRGAAGAPVAEWRRQRCARPRGAGV